MGRGPEGKGGQGGGHILIQSTTPVLFVLFFPFTIIVLLCITFQMGIALYCPSGLEVFSSRNPPPM